MSVVNNMKFMKFFLLIITLFLVPTVFSLEEGDTRELACSGDIPENARLNCVVPCKFTQTFDGSNWTPTEKSFVHDAVGGECTFSCQENYAYDLDTDSCVYNAEVIDCIGEKDSNGIWNDAGQYGVYSSTTEEEKEAHYSKSVEDCAWVCDSNYYYNSDENKCVLGVKTVFCDLSEFGGSLPENAEWNDGGNHGTYTQYLIDGNWTTELTEFNTKEGPCHFDCKLEKRTCDVNEMKYCGLGVQNCVKGYWGECVISDEAKCTENQFCGDGCEFCEENTKNCDLDLTNGCEVNTYTDNNNCGSCGNTCSIDKNCFRGECLTQEDINSILEGEEPPIDPCEEMDCGENAFCSSGSCYCDLNYFNCDGNWENGCESKGNCLFVPKECVSNNDCSVGEECLENKCVVSGKVGCSYDSDCEDTEYCDQKVCKTVLCENGFVADNHECVCQGTECGDTCYTSEGVCCNDVWNKGIDSCSIDISSEEEVVLESNNEVGLYIIGLAKESIDNGEVAKGKAQAKLAVLKAKSGENYKIYYEKATEKINSGNYASAIEEINDAVDLIEEENKPREVNFLPFIILIIIIVLGVSLYFAYPKYIKPLLEQYTSKEDEYIEEPMSFEDEF